MKKILSIGTALLLLPFTSLADTAGLPGQTGLSWLVKIVNDIGQIVKLLIPILVAVTVVAFFWGLVQYIMAGGDEGKVKGKNLMIWGIIALFIEVSLWGIIALIQSTLGVSQGNAPLQAPVIQGSASSGSTASAGSSGTSCPTGTSYVSYGSGSGQSGCVANNTPTP